MLGLEAGIPYFPALISAVFVALFWLERSRPLRPETASKARRNLRNLAVAALSAATVSLVERPAVAPVARLAQERGWGLLGLADLPPWLATALAFILLDYTLYLWHILTHKTALLWRFHQVHHADIDMDASTALRFHVGELMFSVPWRAAQVLLIGVSPQALALWQQALLISILFHHANVELPPALERRLNWLIVTPRMHGIHHSMLRHERDSNWSSGLTLWDWLHGTLRRGEQPAIGIEDERDEGRLGFFRLLVLPLRPNRS
ncbi:MAG: sterol desaturase family protein [Elusimicrobia bacterium]|nr:sterol desaturase family protein [Elusimicrobiota bacterium]